MPVWYNIYKDMGYFQFILNHNVPLTNIAANFSFVATKRILYYI